MNGYEFAICAIAIFFGHITIVAIVNAWRDKGHPKKDETTGGPVNIDKDGYQR